MATCSHNPLNEITATGGTAGAMRSSSATDWRETRSHLPVEVRF